MQSDMFYVLYLHISWLGMILMQSLYFTNNYPLGVCAPSVLSDTFCVTKLLVYLFDRNSNNLYIQNKIIRAPPILGMPRTKRL